MKIKDIMDPSPNLIRTSDTFEHLIKILDEVKYHVVFVVDKEDKLVGIITEGDIIKVLIPKYLTVDESLISVMDVDYFERKCIESKALTINEIMSKVTFMVNEDDPIIKAAALIVVNKIQSVPVVRGAKVVGIVPRSILLKHITKVLTEH
jgi:CBS domain-containing protein